MRLSEIQQTKSALLITAVLLLFNAASDNGVKAQTKETSGIARWASSQLKPEDYVVSKFRDHDVIFLGEMHSVRQNLEFLQRLIPRLQQAGVYTLVYEFADYRDQPAIDGLINADVYEEGNALEILWRCCDLKWVTQEYADVFKAAWKVNHDLSKEARKFRIIGAGRANTDPGGNPLPRGVSTNGLRDGESLLNHFDADNFFWAQVIENEVLSHHEKALVYSGVGHSYTRLYNRRGDYGFAVGNFIFNAIQSRAFSINIHGSAADNRVEVARQVDKLFLSVSPPRYIGFDTATSFASGMRVKQTGYLMDQNKSSGFVLSDVADGYVYLAPLNEWQPVTFRDDFVKQENYMRLEKTWRAEHPRDHPYSLDELRRSALTLIRNQFLYQQGRL
jgi:hypothetical protein